MRSTVGAVAIASAGGFAIALALGGAARAITDTAFQYSSEKTGWFVLSPGSFLPEGGMTSAWTAVGGKELGADTTPVCFISAVNLPQGAKLDAFTIWHNVSADSGELIYQFSRWDIAQQTRTMILNKEATRTPQPTISSKTTKITNAAVQTVNNRDYAYRVRICMQLAAFYGARISYKYTTAGD